MRMRWTLYMTSFFLNPTLVTCFPHHLWCMTNSLLSNSFKSAQLIILIHCRCSISYGGVAFNKWVSGPLGPIKSRNLRTATRRQQGVLWFWVDWLSLTSSSRRKPKPGPFIRVHKIEQRNRTAWSAQAPEEIPAISSDDPESFTRFSFRESTHHKCCWKLVYN